MILTTWPPILFQFLVRQDQSKLDYEPFYTRPVISPCSLSGLSLQGRGHFLIRCSQINTGLLPIPYSCESWFIHQSPWFPPSSRLLDVVALVGIVVGVMVLVVVEMVLLVAVFENLRLAYEDPFELPIVQWGYPRLILSRNAKLYNSCSRGELHCVVSHNLKFVNQTIRQLELWNLAQWEILTLV